MAGVTFVLLPCSRLKLMKYVSGDASSFCLVLIRQS